MIIKKFLNLLFPENLVCLCCGNDIFDNQYYICKSCNKNLPFLVGKLCSHCGEPLISDGDYCKRCKGKKFNFDKAMAVFEYDDIIKTLIHKLKYKGQKYVANSFAKYLSDYFTKTNLKADVIIPVPLCEKRLKTRGYNQSLLISNKMSEFLNITCNDNVLLRIKETPNQTELNYSERQTNLKDAFKVINKKIIKDKIVLLVDDVYTTGATITECSKALKKAGAKCVYAITVAHTIKKD